MLFIVSRHSGRRNGNWRILRQSTDEETVRATYNKEYVNLRAGSVKIEIFDDSGSLIDSHITWAPWLRTRW